MMESDVLLMFLNLLFHISIFFTTLYIAIHNRVINRSVITQLWYVGLASFFCALTIILEFVFGENFFLSYTKVGLFGEVIFNATVFAICATLMVQTVKTDLAFIKNRRASRGRKIK